MFRIPEFLHALVPERILRVVTFDWFARTGQSWGCRGNVRRVKLSSFFLRPAGQESSNYSDNWRANENASVVFASQGGTVRNDIGLREW